MDGIRAIAFGRASGGRGGKKPIGRAVIALVPQALVYNGTMQEQRVASVTLDGVTLAENADYIVCDNAALNAGEHTLVVVGVGGYAGIASARWSIARAQGAISVDPASMTIYKIGETARAAIAVTGDGAVSATTSDGGVATASVSGDTLTVTGVDDGSAAITVSLADSGNYIGASATVSVEVLSKHVYGVVWDGSASPSMTRTDDAADFADPVPAVSGGNGSSPFDACLPWSGMARETVDGNEMVRIPKFWYRWSNGEDGLKLQIADYAREGFHTSPAHADRGDGRGERDWVYIGRYSCNESYGSTAGNLPKVSIRRSHARSGCRALGEGYSQLDYAMFWTVRMLYLVEFASWHAQERIGYGCGNNTNRETTGATDRMIYHTGTMAENRATPGIGVQYRFIEDLWGNVLNWCDGIVLSGKAAYVTNVVADYGDTTANHTRVSIGPSSDKNVIMAWDVPAIPGLEWALFPSEVGGSNYDAYATDKAVLSQSCVCVGGGYTRTTEVGMFYMYSSSVDTATSGIGARLQKLP